MSKPATAKNDTPATDATEETTKAETPETTQETDGGPVGDSGAPDTPVAPRTNAQTVSGLVASLLHLPRYADVPTNAALAREMVEVAYSLTRLIAESHPE